MLRRLVIGAIWLCACASGTAAQQARGLDQAGYRVVLAGQLEGRALSEVSGIASSRRRDDLLWVHNDSGSGPFLYPLSQTGKALGRLRVNRATSRDWEDMASFDFEGRAMLLIADVGDNGANRRQSWLHVIAEPDVPAAGLPSGAETTVEWSVAFRYPEGAADCEAVAVDAQSGIVLLLTKRQLPPRLYSVPLRPPNARPSSSQLVTATFIGHVGTIPGPTAQEIVRDPLRSAYLSQPTSMDRAGDRLLVLTYLHAYEFVREAGAAWSTAIARNPDIILLPAMKQSEALAFDRAGVDAFVTSEKRRAPLYRIIREPRVTTEK